MQITYYCWWSALMRCDAIRCGCVLIHVMGCDAIRCEAKEMSQLPGDASCVCMLVEVVVVMEI